MQVARGRYPLRAGSGGGEGKIAATAHGWLAVETVATGKTVLWVRGPSGPLPPKAAN